MTKRFLLALYILFFQQLLFFVKIEGKSQCRYYTSVNGSIAYTTCDDDCCTTIAPSSDTACCSNVSLSSLAIPFFVVIGICVLGICIIYCRPLWVKCLCGHKCPCSHQARVSSPRPTTANQNPVFVVNNDDLPDYETISKETRLKDPTPPPYTFVTTHPNEFGIESRVPSAPPVYSSRRNSSAIIDTDNSAH